MKRVPPTNRSVRIRPAAGIASLAVGAMLLLAGCGGDHPLDTLAPRGEASRQIHDLVKPVFLVAGLVFILVEGGILFIVLRFRAKRHSEEGIDEPVQVHGNTKLEILWTAIPALMLAFLAVFNVQTIFKLEERDAKTVKVDVVGQQWWWEFRYHLDGDWQGDPEIITANQLVFPAGVQVDMRIKSNDVIHSFWIPALNGKKDAVPGRSHEFQFTADKPGLYEGQCTEYCGLSHGYMRMQAKAVTSSEFDAWVKNQRGPAVSPTTELARKGQTEFQNNCARCHQINGPDGPDPAYAPQGKKVQLQSGNAPNLTHLMSRDTFAGSMLALKDKDGNPDVANLKRWLRDPGEVKPMNALNYQGMPNLNLTPDQIDALVAYLTTLD